MRKKLIAAFAMAALASWHVPAALAMPSQRPVQHASKAQEQSCCPRSHIQLTAALFVLVSPSEMPCGDHPCCAKQRPDNAPVLSAGTGVERPKHAAHTNFAGKRNPIEQRSAMPASTTEFLAPYSVRSTVLRN